MIARVVGVTVKKSGARTVKAICPNGSDVEHGAGYDGESLILCLGTRAAHCRCCEGYTLVVLRDGDVVGSTT